MVAMSIEQEIIEKTVTECKLAHQSDAYFDVAERWMAEQWDWYIRPNIEGGDFSRVLELAPGYGRNTARLARLANEIHLVDVNESCIQRCKQRFGKQAGGCKLFYYVNDGKSLANLPAEYFTFVYSWDSMVHFDRLVVRDYVAEFARVLAPGARGFVHHSNYGVVTESMDWQKNPAWRSNMTRGLFLDYCEIAGLEITSQQYLDWERHRHLDCMSNFRKP
jgi:ubiquinone/menaquinone biosynthesis C-methylase UbiE